MKKNWRRKRKIERLPLILMSETLVSKEDFTKRLGDFTLATELKPVAAKRTEAEAIDNTQKWELLLSFLYYNKYLSLINKKLNKKNT